ncbi:MAG: serine/threonine protein kinase [Methylococcales bacterium]|jgi:serine/threonine protein kinase|nr:serine/threonine protein kinase [Methylococcales bacterium]MBT7444797.1 serine/threonine protein kinase [Methylococcales bacterium]
MTIHNALPVGSKVDVYEVTGVLGVGGFGITYKAYDTQLDREVAIKEYLPPSIAVRRVDGHSVVPSSEVNQKSYEFGLQRFLDEARVLAKFHAPNIVGVNRFLEQNGTAYLIMDYEDGELFFNYLRRQGALSERQFLDIFVPVLEGLKAIHLKSYLHRDIKPSNIYLSEGKYPKLIDFGAARFAWGEQSHTLTQMLTPGYAPFEQYQSHGRQGPWTDLYALGATMYLALTGKKPAEAPERVAALQDGHPDPLDSIEVSREGQYRPEILQVIDWMLEVRPIDRPQNAQQVLHRLTNTQAKLAVQVDEQKVIQGQVQRASRAAQRSVQQRRVTTTAGDIISRRRVPARREESQWLMKSTVALLAMAAMMLFTQYHSKASDPEAPSVYEAAGSAPSSQFTISGIK